MPDIYTPVYSVQGDLVFVLKWTGVAGQSPTKLTPTEYTQATGKTAPQKAS